MTHPRVADHSPRKVCPPFVIVHTMTNISLQPFSRASVDLVSLLRKGPSLESAHFP